MQSRIIECPRDAMQGIRDFIPTEKKIEYLNALMAVGFDTIDFGSFVSPKAIPQLQDTAEVLDNLDLSAGNSKLLAIVLNERGARDAAQFQEITYMGFPLSVSETFQKRNANQTSKEALEMLKRIKSICDKSEQQLVVYLSMGFGNPYGDPWNHDIVMEYTQLVAQEGVEIISLADTVGTAQPSDIRQLFGRLIGEYDWITFGAHFHVSPTDWEAKVEAAYQAGCRRFDAALKGFGGCPFAKDELVGNLATENLLSYLQTHKEPHKDIRKEALKTATLAAEELFATYH
ncbi:MAG: hydroxymethylglutaryl-CoA lyase [Bacteroidetes bacterium]|nr:hydroxymethylglutaryl-CoA lyase [Bacteroidota bacterium]